MGDFARNYGIGDQMKTWSADRIRALARETVDGRRALNNARGEYLKALVGTAQAEIGDAKLDQAAQRSAVSSVSQRFQEYVMEAIATDEILAAAGIARKDIADERNRRLNFVRTNLHAVRRWLRAPGHDLMKLDAAKVTKQQLLRDAPPANKHVLTRKRVQSKYDTQIKKLLDFLKATREYDPNLAADLAVRATRWFSRYIAPPDVEASPKRKLLKAA